MTKIESLISDLKKARTISVDYYEDDSSEQLHVGFTRISEDKDDFVLNFFESDYPEQTAWFPFSQGKTYSIDKIIDWYFYDIFNTSDDEVLGYS